MLVTCKDDGKVGEYLVVYIDDPSPVSVLSLCEVEAITEDIKGQYYISENTLTKDREEYCSETFGGYPANIKDEYEFNMVKDLLKETNNRTDIYIFVGNKESAGDFSQPLFPNATSKVLVLTDEALMPVCSSSLPAAVCLNIFTLHNPITKAWIPNVAANAFFSVTLREPFEIHGVHIKQLGDIKGIKLTLKKESTITLDEMFELPSRVDVWQMIGVGGHVANSINVVLMSFYHLSLPKGIVSLAVTGTTDGWKLLAGKCTDGNSYELGDFDEFNVRMDLCLEYCKILEDCVGVEVEFNTVDHDFEDVNCYYRSQRCEAGNILPNTTYNIFENGEAGVVNHVHRSNKPCFFSSMFVESLSFAACSEKAQEFENAIGFWHYQELCLVCMYQIHSPTATNVWFEFITDQKSLSWRPDFVGCFKLSGIDGIITAPQSMGIKIEKGTVTINHCLFECSNYSFAWKVQESSKSCLCADFIPSTTHSRKCTYNCQFAQMDNCGSSSDSFAIYTTEGNVAPLKDCYVVGRPYFVERHPALYADYHMLTRECEMAGHVLCERDYDWCASDPCQNNGTCSVPEENHILCTCLPGYTGVVCETNINECSSNPCSTNGNCVDNVNEYSCECNTGYTGVHCESEIDECLSSPCGYDGTCTDGVGKVICTCPYGIWGSLCETDLNECANEPCKNGGTCVDMIGKYQCNCLPGYSGPKCGVELDECSSTPCVNGGQCVDQVGQYQCTCPLGYTGTNCETDIDECASSPCMNGATCSDLLDKYLCQCVPGFLGINCNIAINECLSRPCQNGAQCEDLVGGYDCLCLAGFGGPNCEVYVGNPGEWSSWGNWTSCSVTCDAGVRFRERTCEALFPELGVGECDGATSQHAECVMQPCPPVDGSWGSWYHVSECMKQECGLGIVNATRDCSAPPPSNGGKDCARDKPNTRLQLCENVCPVHINCTEWGEWSICEGQCGQTTRSRLRECSTDTANIDHMQSSPSSNISRASTKLLETQAQPCDKDGCLGENLSCHSCSGTSNGANCQGSVTCDTGSLCVSTFTIESASVTVEKKCSSQSECDNLNIDISKGCERLFGLASLTSYRTNENSAPIENELLPEELESIWSSLNGSCSICCSTNNCNANIIPNSLYLPVHSAAEQVYWWTSIAISFHFWILFI